ncbi:acyl transferase/acyl hydrolase/lysophospholipase [Xylaria sp. FL0064]|nr:acyl transferase/acyl hydrolase/lysophospholipase [Xylaria sp. FL0064]
MTFSINLLPPVPAIRPSHVEHQGRRHQTKAPSADSSSTRSHCSPPAVVSVSRAVDKFLYFKDGLTAHQREERRLREERRQVLLARMQNAESCRQWDAAAQELDILEGNEEWKADTLTGDYNPDILAARLMDLDEARLTGDVRAMMYLVRTALSRDLGGMGNIDLYRHSYCGTKQLIERYVDSALQTIAALVENSTPYSHNLGHGDDDGHDDNDDGADGNAKIGPRDLLDALLYARQSFGRSALLLSGGGTFGMTHIGVLKALFEAKLLPRIISGASAGSIVCAVFCAKTDDEIPQLIDEFPHGDLAVFEEHGNEDGILDHLRRLLTEGNWSDIKHLTRVMRGLLGDITFQEAYNRTRRICNICVSTASIYELPRLLNYVTAPNVMIWSAVAASCSVPLVFSAGALLVKNPLTGEHSPWNPTPQVWIDGSVDNDLPMTRLSEMFNVNHFIVSQVNPHVVPFLAKDDMPCPSNNGRHSVIYKDQFDWLHTMTSLAKTEALHRMQVMAEIGVFPNLVGKLRSILSQKYSGDINILPALGVFDLPNILRNPTTEFMTRSCLLGERATWPKLSRIWDRCAIELALDRAVHALRARVVFSKSQVDLRRMVTDPSATGRRGGHERFAAVPMQVDAAHFKGKLKHRRRISSGSSLVNHYGVSYELPNSMIDNDSEDDERLEITMRHPRGKPNLRLKKFPKQNALLSGPQTGPALSSTFETESFDFSQPPITSTRLLNKYPLPSPKRHTTTDVQPPSSGKTTGSDTNHIFETASVTSPPSLGKDAGFGTSASDADVESHADADIDADVFESVLRSPNPCEGNAATPGGQPLSRIIRSLV